MSESSLRVPLVQDYLTGKRLILSPPTLPASAFTSSLPVLDPVLRPATCICGPHPLVTANQPPAFSTSSQGTASTAQPPLPPVHCKPTPQPDSEPEVITCNLDLLSLCAPYLSRSQEVLTHLEGFDADFQVFDRPTKDGAPAGHPWLNKDGTLAALPEQSCR